ncbi:MAG: GNAT family N-acetyltransferase [Moraxellaceae bacterium]|nr:MAG: GNAT family N-acetyltransferase [Moraxellaceae bacterium]
MARLIEVESPQEVDETAILAHEIWNEHFPNIIGQSQVDYMLDKFQSVDAISGQIKAGQLYYLIECHQEVVGYLSLLFQEGVSHTENSSIQLSKLYLLKNSRRQGVAKSVLVLVREIMRQQGAKRLWLTVNKYNDGAIKAYQKLGFVKVGDVVKDIGASFVMDDFEMELLIDSG